MTQVLERGRRDLFAGSVLVMVAAFLMNNAAQAQSWKPDKPVELIAASGAGGNTDKLARTIQRIMQDEKLVPVPIQADANPVTSGPVARSS